MTLFLVLAFLLPWSVWRQMHAHRITRDGLLKLPLIFFAVGVLSLVGTEMPDSAGALAYLGASLVLSSSVGALRGALIPTWRDADGDWNSKGNSTTMGLWTAMIGLKFVLGAVASVTGSLPTESTGEVFLFLGVSFAVQNLVVAYRTLRRDRAVAATAN